MSQQRAVTRASVSTYLAYVIGICGLQLFRIPSARFHLQLLHAIRCLHRPWPPQMQTPSLWPMHLVLSHRFLSLKTAITGSRVIR